MVVSDVTRHSVGSPIRSANFCLLFEQAQSHCGPVNITLGEQMKLSAPTKWVFLVSLLLALLGFLPMIGVSIPAISAYAAWLLVGGYVLLALGTLLKGF